MSGKMARSWDQTSFGTAGTPEALRSPPTGFRGTLPSAIVYAVPEFIWGIPDKAGPDRIGYLNEDKWYAIGLTPQGED